jgi:hypothetical protein
MLTDADGCLLMLTHTDVSSCYYMYQGVLSFCKAQAVDADGC